MFVSAQIYGCTVVCELWYSNVCVKGLQAKRAHSFINFIFLVTREKDQLYINSLESAISIKTPKYPLNVVYHLVRCLLHHYINL